MRLIKRGRKASRPADWDTWGDERKINWIAKKKKPTASELKELRYLTQKKKFAGFRDWLEERNEKEKFTEAYAKRLQRKCRSKRGVETCKQCCRYAICFEGKPPYDKELTGAEIRLGQTIILSIEDSIRRCYQHGWKDQLQYWVKVLASERTNILTAETVDGYASTQAVLKECHKKYGDFEPRYKKCIETYEPKVKELEERLDKAKKSGKITEKITNEINEMLKKLYGDTM